ncbi:MAG: 4a-hydroxytetrahydrobiopterin dehydratase [Burkholderiaceae bacterium]
MSAERPQLSSQLLAWASTNCRSGALRLGTDELAAQLSILDGWALTGDRLEKTFHFADYHHTMAFVNALAWVAHREDHHPDLSVHYNRCVVAFSTHDAGGVTQNDVICAAKAERLFA